MNGKGATLSQGCGRRRFATLIAADKAVDRGAEGTPEKCDRGGLVHWHLKPPAPAPYIPPAVRRLVLARDGRKCVRCGISVIGIRASIHHRKLRSQGGTDTPDCLVTLCGTGTTECHGWVHANPAAARDAGWLVRSGDDPALVSLLIVSERGSGMTVWLTGDGGYLFEPPAVAA